MRPIPNLNGILLLGNTLTPRTFWKSTIGCGVLQRARCNSSSADYSEEATEDDLKRVYLSGATNVGVHIAHPTTSHPLSRQ